MSRELWPCSMKIEVVGVTGDYASGKTLFVCSIDPANTRYYDFEKSAGTYAEGLGIDRVDVPSVMTQKFPKGFTPKQVFEWWYNDLKQIAPGKGPSVIAVDPISDIESGMVDWVKSRHKEWGFKTEEAFVAMGGIFWEKVKSEWKRILTDLTARCQTFAFTTHLKFVWKAGKPTTQLTSKGKTTLKELASLFLFLERNSDQLAPSATVIKSRLARTKFQDGEMQVLTVLPPRLPVATPKAIREYIVNPPNYSALKDEEREQEKILSEADRLELEKEIAETNRATQEAALEVARQAEKAQSAREKALAKLRPKTAPAEEVKEPVVEESLPDDQEAAAKEDPIAVQEIAWKNLRDRLSGDKENSLIVARKTYAVLKARGVNVADFKGVACLEDFLPKLTTEEISEIRESCEV